MKPKFIKYPGQLLAIDLRATEPSLSWSELKAEVLDYAPFSFVLWICPSRIWASQQMNFIATIQSVRQYAGTGGRTGPTALVCPDFMALDWVGPVRAMAIPIYGKDITLTWTTQDGTQHHCNPLHEAPSDHPETQFVQCIGKRPKVDLL